MRDHSVLVTNHMTLRNSPELVGIVHGVKRPIQGCQTMQLRPRGNGNISGERLHGHYIIPLTSQEQGHSPAT
ncbi:hypothetical protein D3C85_1441380 [compost metagenome]